MNTFNADELATKYETFFKGFMPSGFKRDKIGLTGYGVEEISNHMSQVLKSFEHQLFSMLMKAEWIDRRIEYNGRQIPKRRVSMGQSFTHSLKYFWLEYLGHTRSFFANPWYAAVRSYAEDLFPNFDEINILDYDFPYPFQHMKLESLFLVHKMPDRMKFLEEGERKGMSIGEFEDYLAAWMTEEGKAGAKYKFCEGNQLNRGTRYIVRPKTLAERLRAKPTV